MINHRKFLRAPVFLDGLLSPRNSGEGKDERIYNIRIKNISEGGALISSTSQLNKTGEFSLIVELTELPDIGALWLSPASHFLDESHHQFVRVNSCYLGELREINQGVFVYSLVFNDVTIETNKKIKNYIDDSRKLIEFLVSVETQGKPDYSSKAFVTVTDRLNWFDESPSMSDQLNTFYQDLSWSYSG